MDIESDYIKVENFGEMCKKLSYDQSNYLKYMIYNNIKTKSEKIKWYHKLLDKLKINRHIKEDEKLQYYIHKRISNIVAFYDVKNNSFDSYCINVINDSYRISCKYYGKDCAKIIKNIK